MLQSGMQEGIAKRIKITTEDASAVVEVCVRVLSFYVYRVLDFFLPVPLLFSSFLSSLLFLFLFVSSKCDVICLVITDIIH
jgi:hypothetical protein